MSQLDFEKATSYMYFNIDRKYFESTDSKEYIKKLFEEHWFKSEIRQLDVKETSDIYNLNNYIQDMKSNVELFKKII